MAQRPLPLQIDDDERPQDAEKIDARAGRVPALTVVSEIDTGVVGEEELDALARLLGDDLDRLLAGLG